MEKLCAALCIAFAFTGVACANDEAGELGESKDGVSQEDAGSADAPDSMAQEGECDVAGLLASKCAGCHNAAARSGGLDLTVDDLAAQLDGAPGHGQCADQVLIDSALPEQSLLYLKVTDMACGARMPIGGVLSAIEQACMLAWIREL